jgi:predicted DNA-binding transcriptional regulator YafY
MQISRLFEIVYILMNKKSTTAKELSEHFEVSSRTIYRDIETLCQAGIPIYTTKGKGGGISLMENFVLNKSVLSEQEQNEILSALSLFKVTTNEDSGQALSKLGALFGNKRSDWIEVDFSNWNSTEEDKHKFSLLKDSIMNYCVITFQYYNSNGEHSIAVWYL